MRYHQLLSTLNARLVTSVNVPQLFIKLYMEDKTSTELVPCCTRSQFPMYANPISWNTSFDSAVKDYKPSLVNNLKEYGAKQWLYCGTTCIILEYILWVIFSFPDIVTPISYIWISKRVPSYMCHLLHSGKQSEFSNVEFQHAAVPMPAAVWIILP